MDTASKLAPMDVAGRLARLRPLLDEGEGDARADTLLVTSMTNIRYLTGFTGSAGTLVVGPDKATLVTDGRYGEQAEAQIKAAEADVVVEVAGASNQKEILASAVPEKAKHLGLESAHVSWARQRLLAEDWFSGKELVPTVGLVERLRRVKDRGELDRLARAAQIADQALANTRKLLEEAPAEVEFGLALDTEMRRLGAEGPSFDTIVAAGANGAMPHHRPDHTGIEPGKAVVLDFGALVDGYCSDMTRTVWVGELSDAQMRRAVMVVAASQAAGVETVVKGAETKDVDKACRDVIEEAGWGEHFLHSTGHGVGLDIHEAPSVAATSTDTLAAGYVVTVEPGVYLPGLGGVRIEDTVVVDDDGGRTPLTLTPKDLVA